MSDTQSQDTGTVLCQDCDYPTYHVAEFHHIGDGGERVFAVVCGPWIEMYTEVVVRFDD